MRAFLLIAVCLVAADAPDPAFDGKSLTGWDCLPGHWTATNGIILGRSDGSLKTNTFLCSQKRYKDFEMSFQVRLKDGQGNSGVQIRSDILDQKKWSVKGPQADIGDKYWGSLYGEAFGGMMQAADFDKVKVKLKLNDFNDYFIRVVGKKVTIKVNDVTTVDKEFENLPAEGIIALQLHQGMIMEVTYRNIKFKELK
jgi:hypothetical protein